MKIIYTPEFLQGIAKMIETYKHQVDAVGQALPVGKHAADVGEIDLSEGGLAYRLLLKDGGISIGDLYVHAEDCYALQLREGGEISFRGDGTIVQKRGPDQTENEELNPDYAAFEASVIRDIGKFSDLIPKVITENAVEHPEKWDGNRFLGNSNGSTTT